MPNYLENIDLLKQLEPIMERLGVKADNLFATGGDYCKLVSRIPDFDVISQMLNFNYVKTYCSDTLENVLPEWFFKGNGFEYIYDGFYYWTFPCIEHDASLGLKLDYEIGELRCDLISKRGQPKLEALAKLVILLDGEGLLE